MRLWLVAIAASLAAHAALALVLPEHHVAVPVPDEPERPPREPEPIAVAIVTFDGPTPRSGDTGGGMTPGTSIALTTTAGGSETPAAPGTGTPAGHAVMAMRQLGPRGPLAKEFIDNFLIHGKPRELLPDERIAADIQQAWHNGDWMRLQDLRDEQHQLDLQPTGRGTYKADKDGFDVDVDRDGTTHIKDKATLDATDAAMRAAGIDPYASQKLRVLDRTREARAILIKRANKERLAHSAQLMQGHIDRLWRSTRDLAARKQGLFELWDDCAEVGDDEMLAGAAAARHLVIAWIQLELAGGNAYTAEELARLNAKRRSQARFEPYLDAR